MAGSVLDRLDWAPLRFACSRLRLVACASLAAMPPV
jgi:hypothetical protein